MTTLCQSCVFLLRLYSSVYLKGVGGSQVVSRWMGGVGR